MYIFTLYIIVIISDYQLLPIYYYLYLAYSIQLSTTVHQLISILD